MPYVTADDGIRLYYEERGSGDPVLFIHEFGGDHRSRGPRDPRARVARAADEETVDSRARQ